MTNIHTAIHTYRQYKTYDIENQTDRQAIQKYRRATQADSQTDKYPYIQTDRQPASKPGYTDIAIKTLKHTDTQAAKIYNTERQTKRETDRQTDRETNRRIDRQTRHTDIQTDNTHKSDIAYNNAYIETYKQ